MSLDRVDKQILQLLQQDGSLSSAEIAEQVGLTPPPCWRRIKKLQDNGYIDKCVNLLNAKKLGLGVTVFATIKLSAHGKENVETFREKITSYEEVMECYILLGGIDVLVKMNVASVESYHELFFRRLSQIPGVQEVNSSVVVERVKDTTELPIK
ncbi:Lrp/AsnC family transcriptional regulator [Thalassotalea psychrophila]|uniref:Lrp/AsnC family transcriptional regulator n=2 Tax=Thalassotalea TaxID=1518149 RepID=A0ABY9TDP8_9GAMM|nr:Lrp/AsnC family transcriptional regulator [Colwelliaceae bacterium SQ345]WNC74020.1 Lrp/AsnC family transcriptional regulator [Colwelliaceae bacterium SQ149]